MHRFVSGGIRPSGCPLDFPFLRLAISEALRDLNGPATAGIDHLFPVNPAVGTAK